KGDVNNSSKKLKSDLNFTTYKLNVFGILNSFGSTSLGYQIFGMYNIGALPFQNLYSVNGNIDILSQNFSFRTLGVNQIVGGKVATINLEYYFGSELFRIMRIPKLKDWEIQLTIFLNSAFSKVGNETKSILQTPVNTFNHPFYEIGFGIGHALFPLQLEFAWKLNYRDNDNFKIGINALIF
ncbi:MAG: hypothetical protein ABI550_06810, partial [Ignavibacteriaceae bacterium]